MKDLVLNRVGRYVKPASVGKLRLELQDDRDDEASCGVVWMCKRELYEERRNLSIAGKAFD